MDSSTSKPIIATIDISQELLEKYQEELSTLPKEKGWSPLPDFCFYRNFHFLPFFLQGALYARDHFQAQPNDIFLCSFMKAGSTWLKALSFAITTRAQYDDSRSPLLTTMSHDCIPFLEYGEYTTAAGSKIPLFSSHLPYTCLPKSIIDSGCKIVYLWRDPKDTFVSMWHFFRKLVENNYSGEREFVPIGEAFELFCKGVSNHGPYWEHVLGYWKACLERPGEILFIKYEDMMKDTEKYVKKLGEFFGCPFSLEEEREGEVQKIIKFCSFESMSNLEVNKSGKLVRKDKFVENSAYYRKGKVEDWKNYLSAEMGEQLDKIIEMKLSGSGLTFRISPQD